MKELFEVQEREEKKVERYDVVKDLKMKANDLFAVLNQYSKNNFVDQQSLQTFVIKVQEAVMWGEQAATKRQKTGME